jgi:hypothetical protein
VFYATFLPNRDKGGGKRELHEQILIDDLFVNPISIPYIPNLANTIKAFQ